ncbi:MAG: TRAP transporter large permease subunit [Actinobacteria bacterium]|nr:TRAP transporter large permease subunit [Actinomycetota bacterium]
MSWLMLLGMATLLAVVLLSSGQWIAFALGTVGMITLLVAGRGGDLDAVSSISWNSTGDFVFVAIPLFILMGELILKSGLSGRFYRGVAAWLGGLPGGLLHTNVAACAIFSAVSGSSVATAAAIGTVAVPELRAHGYDRRMTYGVLAAGGTLGLLIPPSLGVLVYAVQVQESVSRLFIAGILPGVLLAAMFSLYVLVAVKANPALAPGSGDRVAWRERLIGLANTLPVVALIAVVIGGIYAGLVTPTEAAALGAFGALVVSVVFGGMRVPQFLVAVRSTVRTNCMIIFIIVGAQILSFSFVSSGVTRRLVEAVVALEISPLALFVVLCAAFIVLGTVIDGLSLMVLTLPILFPVVQAVGYDTVWFGIVMILFVELGQITPPVGLNLFVLQGVSGERLGEVVRGALPFAVVILAMIGLLYAFPQIALWPTQFIN